MQKILFKDYPSVVDRLRARAEQLLEPAEVQRLERQLQLIERDRLIRAAFKRLRKQGVQVLDAIYQLAEQSWNGEYLSAAQIDWIIYQRERSKAPAS